MDNFNYDAMAELYPSRRYAKSQQTQYRRFKKASEAVRYMIEHGTLVQGSQSRLAEHFKVTRQRVHQIVVEERQRLARTSSTEPTMATAAQPSWRAS